MTELVAVIGYVSIGEQHLIHCPTVEAYEANIDVVRNNPTVFRDVQVWECSPLDTIVQA